MNTRCSKFWLVVKALQAIRQKDIAIRCTQPTLADVQHTSDEEETAFSESFSVCLLLLKCGKTGAVSEQSDYQHLLKGSFPGDNSTIAEGL